MYCIEKSTIQTPAAQPRNTNTASSSGKFSFKQQQCVCMQCNQCASPHYLHYLLQLSFSLLFVAGMTVGIIIAILFGIVFTLAVTSVVVDIVKREWKKFWKKSALQTDARE